MNALGIHVFAGGFSVGVQKHFKIIAHLEQTKWAQATLEYNFPTVPRYHGPNNWPFEFEEDIDLVYGNPPCAIWSAASGKKSNPRDPRFAYHENFLSVALQVKPKIIVSESVPGILKAGWSFIEKFYKQVAAEGYALTLIKTNANFHGVPQQRRRVFIVAHKVELDLPGLIHSRETVLSQLEKYDIDVEEVFIRNQDRVNLLPFLKQGKKLRDLYFQTYEPTRKGRPGMLEARLRGDSFSPTILTAAIYIHPTEDRFICPAEAAALCGYPKDYKFIGAMGDRFKQIGAAVLPGPGEWIGHLAKDSIIQNCEILDTDLRQITLQ